MASFASISTAAQQELDRIAKLFHVSNDDLVNITKAIGEAYSRGLQTPNQPIVMGPSFTHGAKGTEKGIFLTLDISWASFQVATITLDGKRSSTSTCKVFDISPAIMKEDCVVFFDFLASGIKKFTTENGISGLPLAFTFPFPTQKTGIAEATCTGLSKGFLIKGIIGQDVVKLLQNAIDRQGVNVKVVSVVNDTVAAILSESYLSSPCIMSVIYGAGTNGSYNEHGSAIAKLPQFQGDSMLINTEWGAFSERTLLRPTVYDDQLDQASVNPGGYTLQKMTCWYYLGEIARYIFLSLIQRSPPLLFGGLITDPLKKKHGFASFHLCQIEDAKSLHEVKELITTVLGYSKDTVSDEDAEIVRHICTLIGTRSGKLAGAPVAALLAHLGHGSIGKANAGGGVPLPIVVDGELFIGSTQFASRLKESIAIILGAGVEKRLDFRPLKQGGIVGAAVSAYDAVNNPIN